MSQSFLFIALLGAPSVVAGVAGAPGPAGINGVPTQAAFDHAIQHIVIVMMENHAFDNYYGVYCSTRGTYCSQTVSGIPAGTCVPRNASNLSRGCIVPFPLGPKNLSVHAPLPHSQNSSLASYNNGAMNGFYLAEKSGNYPFGYYTGKTAPLMWDLAEEYGLGDSFFSSTLAYSLPNHWHLVAAQAPPEIQAAGFTNSLNNRLANRTLYLHQANNTPTIEDLLAKTNITWKWYDHAIANNYSAAIRSLNSTGPQGTAFLLWNPMAAKAESYNTSYISHFVNNTGFFKAAQSGRLPQLSYLIPPGVDSDHPPGSTALAQHWLASVVDAVEASPQWNHTALFITYDEYGGFYDNVPPPKAVGTNLTLGFRVPFLVISPYAKENYVSNSTCYFECLLGLVEDRFGLPCLTAMDCNAPSLLNYFHFNQPPRPPIIFPTAYQNMSYPMPLQNATNFNTWPRASFQAPEDVVYFPYGEGPDID